MSARVPVPRADRRRGAGYVPVVRGGGKMHVRMLCLGRHWNGRTYEYEETRERFRRPAGAAAPRQFRHARTRHRRGGGHDVDPISASSTTTTTTAGWACTRTRTKGARSIAAGLPVVSVSLGDTARFLFGGLRRRDPVEAILLESGDVFVFGGAARLRYHGVSRIMPHGAARRSR